MKTHKNLVVWQKSMQLVNELYRVTRQFPKEELYGLISQMRRAAVSIPSNIAEGYGRGHNKQILQFLYISLGSASELETQLIISKDENYLSEEEFDNLNDLNNEIIRMLSSLIEKRENFS